MGSFRPALSRHRRLEKGASDADGLGNHINPARIEIFGRLRNRLSYRGMLTVTPKADDRESPLRLEQNRDDIRRDFEILKSPVNSSNAA